MNTSLTLLTVIGLVAVAGLVWLFLRYRKQDHFADIINKYKTSSRVAHTGVFVEGIEQVPVVMVLTDRALLYENEDLQANLDLDLVDEVDYDDELSTGKTIHNGRVMRFRAHGRVFEFIVDKAHAAQWEKLLPARRLDGGQLKVG